MTKPSKSIQDFAKKAQLWPHQITALGMIEHYLHTVAGSDTDKLAHALVNLPTGCGKTGVIACASRLLKSVTVSVVLAPRVALRDQLHDQIKSAFFESRNVTDLVPPALVVRVEQPTDWECHPPTGSRIIYVGTLQAADSYRRRAPTALARLAPNVDLIFVD